MEIDTGQFAALTARVAALEAAASGFGTRIREVEQAQAAGRLIWDAAREYASRPAPAAPRPRPRHLQAVDGQP